MPSFDKRSLANLAKLHPKLQEIFKAAIKECSFEFLITDSQRGKIAQELAYRRGNSKVRFGQSAHNWQPSIAADIYPAPFATKLTKAESDRFVVLQLKVVKPIADRLGIPIRQGIDFNRNGILTDDNWDDLPHVELHPWREWAKKAKPFEG